MDIEKLLDASGFEKQVSLTEPYVNAMAVRRVVEAAVAEAVATERAATVKLLSLPMAELLLMAGEMTVGEKRTLRAVLDGLKSRLKAV